MEKFLSLIALNQNSLVYRSRCCRVNACVIGGYSLKVAGHLWDENKKFGYRFYDSSEALTDAHLTLLEEELGPLIPQGLAAVYTQTTDVEIEINGYLTYDRKVEKMNTEKTRQAHAELCQFLR